MKENLSPATKRFVALDSLRGILACFIVLYHFNNAVFNHLVSARIITNATIFVDFFFVLSGFVITANYENKILNGLAIKDYIFLRFVRLYPLHFCILIAILAFQILMAIVSHQPFSFADGYSIEYLLASLFLVQSVGFPALSLWNPPSWSISAEFYTYILFAISLLLFKRSIWIIATLIIVLCPFFFYLIGKVNINITYDFGIIRCIYGFLSGVVSYKVYLGLCKRREEKRREEKRIIGANHIEIVTTLLIGLFVIYLGKSIFSLWAPPLLAFAIIVFAFERGVISKTLMRKPFVTIGLLSYSIYMTHTLVQSVLYNAAKLIQKHSGLSLFNEDYIKGTDQHLLGATIWHGDLWQLIGLLAVIIVSYVTYHLIENPANRWIRRYIQEKRHKNIPQANSSAF